MTRETFEFEICDVAVFRRTVELPLRCPKCGADFCDDEAANLRVVEYQDQTRFAVVGAEDGDLDWPDLPEGGETFMQVSAACARCGEVLAKGKELG